MINDEDLMNKTKETTNKRKNKEPKYKCKKFLRRRKSINTCH